MPLDDLSNVLLLIARTGDVDPVSGDPIPFQSTGSNGIVMLNADRIWQKYAIYRSIQPAALGSEIYDHYFMITAEQLITAVLAERITFAGVGTAVKVNLSDRWAHHKAMLDMFNQELNVLFERASKYATPAVAPILTVEAIVPPVPGQIPSPLWQVGQANTFTLDASNYVTQGSPYWNTWRRW